MTTSRRHAITHLLSTLLSSRGFSLGEDFILRAWNPKRDICCAIGVKQFSTPSLVTLEVGFISPLIRQWCGIASTTAPTPSDGNGYGLFYRLNDLGIQAGYIFPPGGWDVTSTEQWLAFSALITTEFTPKVTALLKILLTWDGWIHHFRTETQAFPQGRGIAWTLLGYSLLANPSSSLSDIESAINQHAAQDGSKKIANRLDTHIAKQRLLLNQRIASQP